MRCSGQSKAAGRRFAVGFETLSIMGNGQPGILTPLSHYVLFHNSPSSLDNTQQTNNTTNQGTTIMLWTRYQNTVFF